MRGGAAAGFTLLELLVTLVVLGLLVLGLSQGMRFGTLAWRMQRRDVELEAGVEPADRALRRLIAAADPDGGPDGFTGGPHTLAFATRLPASVATGPTPNAEVALGVDAARRLVLRWVPAPHATALGPPAQPRQAVLARDVAALDLAYARPAGQGGGWVARWSGKAPPALVRLSIRFAAGDAHAWPEIVAAPRRAAGTD